MAVTGINSLMQGTGIADILREMREGQQEDLLAAAGKDIIGTALNEGVLPRTSSTADSNLIARNFMTNDPEESKYLSAVKSSRELENQMGYTKARDVISEVMSASESIQQAAREYGSGRLRNAKNLERLLKAHEETFDKTRERIEEKAQEALAPKDGNGEPVPTLSTEGSGADLPKADTHGIGDELPPAAASEASAGLSAAISAYSGTADISAALSTASIVV